MEGYKTPRRQSMDIPWAKVLLMIQEHSIDSRTGSKRIVLLSIMMKSIQMKSVTALKNWPLPPEPIEQAVAPPSRVPSRARSSRTSRRSTASPSPSRPNMHRSRPSRFMEGSMNDKVSQLPPTPYLYHEEELRERYIEDELMGNNGQTSPGRRMAKPRGFMQHSNKSMGGESSLAGISDTSRQSTIFRFVQEETPQQRAVRERQEKAEKMYHELKANGFFRDGAIVQQPGFKPVRHSMDQHHDLSMILQSYQQPYQPSYRPSPSYQQPCQQQLSHALPPPPPDRYGRARFVPGALATLPSERLLSNYVDPEANFNEDENEDFHAIGTAITTQDSMDHTRLVVEVKSTSSRIMSQVASIEEGKAPQAKTGRPRAIKKNADNDRIFRPTPDSDSDSDQDAKVKPPRKIRRQPKSQTD
ncbi:hypothetical protein DID88_006263 [Monilinia fructigena]|uniref:Uncharacterized protein n=1 Tax=Monilinia fructigena TaxID=38457 RepID=A0A395J4J4_9HELO|nr:hypothetical protein DID88_006263 [Monilinia fructigena]